MGRFSGKASYIKVEGVRVDITKSTPKVNRELKESTDSSCYDASSDMLQPTQVPVKVATELAIEGFYYLESTGQLFLNWAFSGGGPKAVILYLTTTGIFGHANYDLADFEAGVPIDDMVTFSATLKQHGVFTPNA